MSESLILALALVLVLEGILPFAVPALWRHAMNRLAGLNDSQIRLMGFISMMGGVLIALALV